MTNHTTHMIVPTTSQNIGCPACGKSLDHCEGHPVTRDRAANAILDAHDRGDHTGCHPDGCREAAGEPVEDAESTEVPEPQPTLDSVVAATLVAEAEASIAIDEEVGGPAPAHAPHTKQECEACGKRRELYWNDDWDGAVCEECDQLTPDDTPDPEVLDPLPLGKPAVEALRDVVESIPEVVPEYEPEPPAESGLKWSSPPPAQKRFSWEDVAAELKSHPHNWAEVLSDPDRAHANRCRNALRYHGISTRQKTSKGVTTVWAAYEPKEAD